MVADREFAGDLARRHGGPFVAAFLDTAPAVRFLAQRNPALADWLAVADAPTLARSFDPSLADRIGFARLHVREATKDLTVDDALASGQKALTNVAAQLTNVGAGLQERFPRTAGAFRGGDAGAAAAAGVGPDVAPDGAAAAAAFAQPTPTAPAAAAAVRQPERRGPRRVAVARSALGDHREGAVGRPGCRRLRSGQGRADAARRLLPAELLDGQRGLAAHASVGRRGRLLRRAAGRRAQRRGVM